MSQCPCGSGVALTDCGQPILDNPKMAATAEQMMRSRYTAFFVENFDHIFRTHDPKTVKKLNKEEK